MLDVVTSANVACGFHAGDAATLARTCRAAAERGVRIGAQVSYRDLAGFGRRFIDVDARGPDRPTSSIRSARCRRWRTPPALTVSYVKPHGALYNTIVTNHGQAARSCRGGTRRSTPSLPVLGLSGSVFFDRGRRRRGLRTVARGVRRPRLPAPTDNSFRGANADAVLHDADRDRRSGGVDGDGEAGSPRSTAPGSP